SGAGTGPSAKALRAGEGNAGSRRPIGSLKPYYRGPPMTLGNAATACVRLVGWCKDAGITEPDPAQQVQRYGAETSFLDWRERVCSPWATRDIKMVVTEREWRTD